MTSFSEEQLNPQQDRSAWQPQPEQQQQQQQRPLQPLSSQPRPANSASQTEPYQTPPPRTPRGSNSRRSGGSTPRSLGQILREADRMVVQGELDEFLPVPTGFDQIDRLIGGGLRRTGVVLLGGAQG
ncbi:MAG TPA: hypothetical protein PKD98_24805, partial [Anaerolineae bacterium]|nr:hypothetical protein [Anaerolineae bacterium]